MPYRNKTVMTWVVVIKTGASINASLSSIEYDRHGQRTRQPVIVCDNWAMGFQQATDLGYKQALFVDSGTVFTDWSQWQTFVDSYPHQGLIAHLIWHPGQSLMVDPQCWFMDLEFFNTEDFSVQYVAHPQPRRSDIDLHDDYTPLWVRPAQETMEYNVDGFGQGLIARQLQRGKGIVNWTKQARALKWYLYPKQPELLNQVHVAAKDYITLAEKQLWVLNNEDTRVATGSRLLAPGAGMMWMLNIIQPNIKHLQVVDISHVQIKFCSELWHNWNGIDYGSFAWDFIKHHGLKHFEIDQADLSALERLKLHNQKTFVAHVNAKFDSVLNEHGIQYFAQHWTQAKQNKQPNFVVGNLVDWVLENGVDNYDCVWCSNILTYKWTLLNNTQAEFEQFKNKVNQITCL